MMGTEINCDTVPKAKNRELIRDFIAKNSNSSKRKNFNVLCLPGFNQENGENIEISQIWKPLGIKNRNIYAITNDKEQISIIKSYRNVNSIFYDLFNDDPFKIIKFLIKKNKNIDFYTCNFEDRFKINIPFFDVIYLDIYRNYSIETIIDLYLIGSCFLKNNGFFGITFQRSREKGVSGKNLINTSENLKVSKLSVIYMKIIRNFLFLRHIKQGKVSKSSLTLARKYGWYPVKDIITRYIGDNGTPMGTIFLKMRRLSCLNHYQVKKKVSNYFGDFVGKSSSMRVNTIKEKSKVVHVNKPKKYDKKSIVIDLLKESKSKNDDLVISEMTGYTIRQLAAIKAHITMGTYGLI